MVALRRQSETPLDADAPAQASGVFRTPAADARVLLTRVRAFAEAPQKPPVRWSRRRTLVFVVAASGVAWGGLLALAVAFPRTP